MSVLNQSQVPEFIDPSSQERHPLMTETDINNILVNGAMISLSKLKRARSFDARLYYYAEIGVYLEVSLSRGAGITDETRETLERIHMEATHEHMDANKALNQRLS
ncbi:excinuclease ABC subunit C [Marinobacterium arenosum]|uniref:excinuclease ABC subunit C n=1 Tax=Marinobacterium arenosum TaxID=2862496 RepID=UPI001C987733|nr:excinuclease ABC subunit C [Marinobacterium arenosum]MBY4677212.1 excinuclease ABC subunit C [Marinobacterium arenosum]